MTSDHAHGHGHEHGHGGHTHGVSADADRRWLGIALALITAFMAVEVFVGVVAGSLALISDAAHMLTDAAAIVLALIAMRLAERPAAGGFTYGLKRAEILSAQVNGLSSDDGSFSASEPSIPALSHAGVSKSASISGSEPYPLSGPSISSPAPA